MAKNGNKRRRDSTLADVDSLTPRKIRDTKGLAPVIPTRRSTRTSRKSYDDDDDEASIIESSQIQPPPKVRNVSH